MREEKWQKSSDSIKPLILMKLPNRISATYKYYVFLTDKYINACSTIVRY